CQNMMLASPGSSTYASGSLGFVLGVTAANAVADGIVKAQMYRNCMTMQGWQTAPAPQSQHTPPPTHSKCHNSVFARRLGGSSICGACEVRASGHVRSLP